MRAALYILATKVLQSSAVLEWTKNYSHGKLLGKKPCWVHVWELEANRNSFGGGIQTG